MKLSQSFYANDDVVSVARDLLGKVLCTRSSAGVTKAIIVETEAYEGVTDKASHAYGGRRTKRTEPMFGPAGRAYVYLCYGIHHLFNVVTSQENVPHAVLIRAGEPLSGIDLMLRRRGKSRTDKSLLAGPGSLAKALGITTDHTGSSLLTGEIWIEDRGFEADAAYEVVDPRVGVEYAGKDALRPYRFLASSLNSDEGFCSKTQ